MGVLLSVLTTLAMSTSVEYNSFENMNVLYVENNQTHIGFVVEIDTNSNY